MDLGDEIFEMPMAGPYFGDQIVPVLDESEQDSNYNLKPLYFGPTTFCGGNWKGGKPCEYGQNQLNYQPYTPPKEVPQPHAVLRAFTVAARRALKKADGDDTATELYNRLRALESMEKEK